MNRILTLLVCGGRRYAEADQAEGLRMFDWLTRFHVRHGVECLVHGDAGCPDPKTIFGICGADQLSGLWARLHAIPVRKEPISKEEWDRYGLAAGPARNIRMFRKYPISRVVAFPGGRGTEHAMSVARQEGIPVDQPFCCKST